MARNGGMEELQAASGSGASRGVRGRPALLSGQENTRLRQDLISPPSAFGFEAARWSGNLLARHLECSYGITVSARQCRRILGRLTPGAHRAVNRRSASEPLRTAKLERVARIQLLSAYPNLYRQQEALRRLRRLASSGLSAMEFAMGAFDLVADAIPNSECKAFHLSGATPTVWWPWFVRNIEWKWAPDYQRYVTERSVKERGIIDPMTAQQKPVYRHEELMAENWERTETYNELYRHWGFHHVLYVWGIDGSQFAGGLPIWRSAGMRPFTNDDVRFATSASGLIGHALGVARGLESHHVEGEEFFTAQGRARGVILITDEGRILAIDKGVQQIFGKMAVFDGIQEHIVNQKIAPFLRYLARTLREIFSRHADGADFLLPPNACLYLHRSGVALRFHGFLAQGEQGKGYYSVLVEAGELTAHRRRRLMLSYGLSPRELDVLRVIGQGKRGREAAAALRIAPGTFYKYTRQVMEKLDIADSPSLRKFARNAAV